MNIVMFHSGEHLPSYLNDCFRQLRLFNPDIPVYFLTDHRFLISPIFSAYNIRMLDKDLFHSDDIRRFEVFYGRGCHDFWTITSTRLIYIANFIEKYNLKDVCHFENDVLIYADLSLYEKLFCDMYKNLAITIGGEDKAMTGFLFIKNPKALRQLANFFLELLNKHKIKDIRSMYGMDMVNEMTLIRAFSKEHPELIEALPTVPFGELSKGFQEFKSIFDPASWGQFVGGTTDGVPGAKPGDHYIGRMLTQNPDYTVVWKNEDKGKIPYFKYNGQEVMINNLHIHSKNLHLYVSK